MHLLLCALTLLTAPIAPNFQGISKWVNSEPQNLENLRGQVVLIDFWDYTCINCIRTIPHLNTWYNTYKDKGFTVIGIHTPEFAFEQSIENVKAAVKRFGIQYPVGLDNDYKTWRAYRNKYWPTTYLVNKEGEIVFTHIGEGKYLELENAIRAQLGLAAIESELPESPRKSITTEIYLGSSRAENYAPEIHIEPNKVHAYTFKPPLRDDTVGIKGLWRVAPDSITSAGSNCQIELKVTAGKVHAVIAGSSADPITVYLDGKPLKKEFYTSDINAEGQIFLSGDRKYDLVDQQGEVGTHTITLWVPPGISFYTFSFGT